MYGIFDGLFDSLSQSWNRSFKEKDGYTILPEKNGNGYLIIFNTLGINEKDIKVTHKPQNDSSTYLRVSGSTKIEELGNQLYSANYELIFNNKDNIESVQYKVKDGLTIVYIKTKKKENSIGTEATNIAEGDDFDW